jgi:hypothetical protein
MGFLDFFTKKKETAKAQVSSKSQVHPFRSSMELIKNQELYNVVATYTATCLSSINMTETASLKSFNDDKGLLDSLVFSATVAPAYSRLKDKSQNEFLGVCGSNAFGRGLYVAGMQNELNKPISQFTIQEVEDIVGAFCYTPDFELGLKMINVEAGSDKHRAFRDLVIKVANYYLANCAEPMEDDNIRSYLQALFNAGVTTIYR